MKIIRAGLFSIILLGLFSQQALADWKISPEVFEAIYYADANPDVEKAFKYDEAKLAKHWLDSGLKEGRASSPVFSVRYYLQKNRTCKKPSVSTILKRQRIIGLLPVSRKDV